MIPLTKIGWGSYLGWEGPFFHGTQPYVLPTTPNFAEVCLGVVTATEGGSANAINMYDRCVLSVGWIQWCEAGQYSVSDMLGAVHEHPKANWEPMQAWLAHAGVDFRMNSKGKYRFFFRDVRGEIDRTQEQQQLFLLRSNGEKGTWDDGSREYAKLAAAAVASLFEDPGAREAQLQYTVPRLMGFVLPEAKTTLFGTGVWGDQAESPYALAAKAAYISFAANNPTIARNQMVLWQANTGRINPKDLCIGLLRQLTFGPKIAIYPTRYEAIRPVLEKSFGVDLPDFATELGAWHTEANIDHSSDPEDRLDTVVEIQKVLLKLGFDLGPWGADGAMGTKTKLAIMTFQSQHGLVVDGVVGKMTRHALVDAFA